MNEKIGNVEVEKEIAGEINEVIQHSINLAIDPIDAERYKKLNLHTHYYCYDILEDLIDNEIADKIMRRIKEGKEKLHSEEELYKLLK